MKLAIHALLTMLATNAIAIAKSAPQLDSNRDNLVEAFQSSLGPLRADATACEVSNNTRVQLIISARWRCACD